MRPTRAVIDLAAFARNLALIRNHVADHVLLCIAVKADAYGHGIEQIARTAVDAGVEYLAVATVDEAVAVREEGLSIPLLLYSLPAPEEIPTIVSHRITPLVADEQFVSRLDAEASRHGVIVPVHMKIDTGMGRIGCRPEDAGVLAESIDSRGGVRLEGVSTHFPAADTRDREFTNRQIETFNAAVDDIRSRGVDPGVIHASNSGGLLDYPEAHYDMVRPGILAYGYYPSGEQDRRLPVRPVMKLVSKVVFLKRVEEGTPISYGMTYRCPSETVIATIPVGYGDGYFCVLSNRATVSIGGTRYPVVGRVCMDQLMVDLGPSPDVRLYEEVVLFGADDGAPTAEELANLADTIPYEITCAISKRVPRIYRGGVSGEERSRRTPISARD
jgi:alanine racemase